MTGGGYDLYSYKNMNDDYGKRQERMQKLAESAGLGWENKLANFAIDSGGKVQFLKKTGLLNFLKNIGKGVK